MNSNGLLNGYYGSTAQQRLADRFSDYHDPTPPKGFYDPCTWKAKIHSGLGLRSDPASIDRYLEDRESDSEGIQKAKEYWASYRTYEENKEQIDQIREQFPDEVETVRKKLWKRFVINRAEGRLTLFYLNGNPNRTDVPENFNLKSYKMLEPQDHPEIALSLFPEALKAIGYAKKYWLGKVSAEEKENAPEKYKLQVERFRVLLWERHLQCVWMKAENQKELEKVNRMSREKDWEMFCRTGRRIKTFFMVLAAVAVVAGFFLSSSSRPGVNLPFLRGLFSIVSSHHKEALKRTQESVKEKETYLAIHRNFDLPSRNIFCACSGGTVNCHWNINKDKMLRAKL